MRSPAMTGFNPGEANDAVHGASEAIGTRTPVDPATPRLCEDDISTASSSPFTTPRHLTKHVPESPPQAPRSNKLTPMMEALRADSPALVHKALKMNSDAAWEPLWDHKAEPPLCFAVRNLCSAAVVSILLHNKADPAATDEFGKCVADHLRSRFKSPHYVDAGEVAKLLNVELASVTTQTPDIEFGHGQLPPWARPCAHLPWVSSWPPLPPVVLVSSCPPPLVAVP